MRHHRTPVLVTCECSMVFVFPSFEGCYRYKGKDILETCAHASDAHGCQCGFPHMHHGMPLIPQAQTIASRRQSPREIYRGDPRRREHPPEDHAMRALAFPRNQTHTFPISRLRPNTPTTGPRSFRCRAHLYYMYTLATSWSRQQFT